MVLGGQIDYPIAHPKPYSTGYGQSGGHGFGSSFGQPCQPTNLGGYPYNLGGSENGHSSSLQQVRPYPNIVSPLPSNQMVAPPQGYNYDHGIKPHGYENAHGYEKHSNSHHGYGINNTHGEYEKHSNSHHGYGINTHGDYGKHSNSHGYGINTHGDYEKHSNSHGYGYGNNTHGGYDRHSNGGHHEGHGNGMYPNHGASKVESMSYEWIRKGLDD